MFAYLSPLVFGIALLLFELLQGNALLAAIQITTMAALSFSLGLWCLRRGVMHPLVWWPIGFLLYAIPYPIILLIEGRPSIASEVMSLNWVALAASIVGISLIADPLRNSHGAANQWGAAWQPGADKSVLRLMIMTCLLLACMAAALAAASGIATKRDFLNLSNEVVWLRLIMLALVAVALLPALMIQRRDQSRGFGGALELSLYAAALLLVVAVTGERDYILRLGVAALFILYFPNRAPTRTRFIVLILSAWPLIWLSAALKPGVDVASLGYTGLESILYSDFAASGRIIAFLIEQGAVPGSANTLSSAFERLLPFGMAGGSTEVLGGGGQWFHNVFRPDVGQGGVSGWGFSLVADAWISGGYPAVLVIFFIIGIWIALLYRFAYRGPMWFALFVFSSSNFVYALRADLASVLAMNIKFALVVFLTPVLITKAMRSLSQRRLTVPAAR